MLRTPDPAASADHLEPVTEAAARRVRTPFFPPYDEVRHLLQVWAGRHRKQVTGLERSLMALRGTPQDPVDWRDPDAWIPKRLTGEDRELAHAIWKESVGQVNPRHTYGHWLLSQTYELLESGPDGVLALTERGRAFLDEEGGSAEMLLDEQEGILHILTLVDDLGPTRRAGLLKDWTDYLNRYSRFNAPSTYSDTLRRRLTNLLRRALVRRDRAEYSITAAGADYLLQQRGTRDQKQRQREPVADDELRDGERDSGSAEAPLLEVREAGRGALAGSTSERLGGAAMLPVSDPSPQSGLRLAPPRADEDGAEVEEREIADDEERPFDPAKIKVRTIPIVVDQVAARLKYGEIDLAPDFQRLRGIWKARNKSRLIESLLLRIPIPVFYVAADNEDHWAVVDGVQRISTITDYMAGKFPLRQLEYRTELNGRHFADLPRNMQRRISETQLTVNVIEPGTPPEVMFNIFRRINTGGEPLTAQEIRHALHQGPARAFLKRLAESQAFLKATNGSISPRRMADRECVLRFLAFHIRPWEDYRADSLDGFLGDTMRRINVAAADQRTRWAQDFEKAMRAARAILRDDAFRKRYDPHHKKFPVSKPLFEAWSVTLARCSSDDVRRLASLRRPVRDRFMDLLNGDSAFEQAVSLSTDQRRRITKRFGAVQNLVQEVLRCSNESD